jgi:hypothetical protein
MMTEQNNLTTADLGTLAKEQLIAMVGLRGATLQKGIEADNALMAAILSGSFTHEDFMRWNDAKIEILIQFGEAETAIIFPAGEGQRVN